MKLNNFIQNRWSPRAFSDQTVEQDKLDLLFEAARWAPSSRNEQPWRFLYGRKGEEAYQKIYDALLEGNQIWAGKAPVLIVVACKTHFQYKDLPNRHAWYDTGQAMGNLSLQATEMGIYLHQMAGFEPQKVKDSFGFDENFEPIAVVAIGHLGEPDQLPEKLKDSELAERKRKATREFVFKGKWENK